MAEHPCFTKLKSAFNDLDDDDLRKILNELEDERKTALEKNQSLHESLIARGDKIFEDSAREQDLRKLRFFRRIEVRSKALLNIEPWKDSTNGLFRGAKSFLVGTEHARFGARDSVEGAQYANEANLFHRWNREIQDADGQDIINSDEHELNYLKALMDEEVEDDRVNRIAAITKRRRDDIDRRYKRYGIFINPLDRFGIRHFWSNKELSKTSDDFREQTRDLTQLTPEQRKIKQSNRFVDFLFKSKADTLLDLDKTKTKVGVSLNDLSETEIRQFLHSSFVTLSNGGKFTDVGTSMADRVGAKRILRFKDAESYLKANKKFGVGTIGQAATREIQMGAKNLALLDKLGDNPKAMFNSIIAQAVKDVPEFKLGFSKGKKRLLDNTLDEVMGTFNDASSSLARNGANARAFTNLTTSGSVILSALSDLAPVSLQNARMMGSWSDGMLQGLKNIMDKNTRSLNQKLEKYITIYTHNDMGQSLRVFSSDDQSSNVMTKLKRLQMKLGLMNFWDAGHRSGVAAIAAKSLAEHKNLDFAKMEKTQVGRDTITSMKQYGVDSNLWDLMRGVGPTKIDGSEYITQDSIRNVADEDIRTFLTNKGVKRITRTGIQDVKDEVEQKLALYFVDRVDHAILRPSAADKQMWHQGTNAGTVAGQFMRFISMYKLYATSFISKPLSQLIYGRGADTLKQSILEGKGDMQGLGILVAYATSLGYMGNAARSLLANETPSSPFSERGFFNALQSGGGLTLYGNILTSDPNKFGGGLFQQLAGPALSKGGQAFKDIFGLLHGSTSKSQLVNLVKQNIPLGNLPYSKGALDYLIFNQLQEQINPGYYYNKLAELHQQHRNFLFSPI